MALTWIKCTLIVITLDNYTECDVKMVKFDICWKLFQYFSVARKTNECFAKSLELNKEEMNGPPY